MNKIDKIDILEIDRKIRSTFNKERGKLIEYQRRLTELKNMNHIPDRMKNEVKKNIIDLERKIHDIETAGKESFYNIETIELVERYKTILKTPVVVSFSGVTKTNNKEKRKIIHDYLKIAQKYIEIPSISVNKKKKVNKIVCDCGNKTNFDCFDEDLYICEECGAHIEISLHSISYKDIDRVNISTKYSYDRRVHFKDLINQYQGKQNTTIDQKVYDMLEKEFKNHHLLVDSPNRLKRFSRVRLADTVRFLKELGLTKHYENAILIHYNITGQKPDDISHLEDTLMKDFDTFVTIYDKNYKGNIDRRSFVSAQNVLYRLLCRHKHPCKRENFAMLKTTDRQNFHDEITADCFQKAGWNTDFF